MDNLVRSEILKLKAYDAIQSIYDPLTFKEYRGSIHTNMTAEEHVQICQEGKVIADALKNTLDYIFRTNYE